MKIAVDEFLAQKRIAVAGVSHSKKDQPANLVYRKLRDHGYDVFAVNPAAEEVEGDKCYPNLAAIPANLDGVVIATDAAVTPKIMNECIELNIPRVWIHSAIGNGSAAPEAVKLGREHGITVIPAGCPMMYCEPDPGHRCMRWIFSATGKIPKTV